EVHDAGKFYDKYEPSAYAFALRELRNPQEAEDCTQDAFLAVTRHWERVRYGPGSTRAYLFTVLRNEIKGHQKSKGIRPEALWDTADEAKEVTDPTAEDPIQRITDYADLHAALEQLPEPQREAVALSYFLDKSENDIASVTGVNVNTAKSRVQAGR